MSAGRTGALTILAGAGSAPLLTTMTEWVEKGHVPAEALEFTLDDQPTRHGATRPLCQYPNFRGTRVLAMQIVRVASTA